MQRHPIKIRAIAAEYRLSAFPQPTNSIPNLNVPWVVLTNSASSMPNWALNNLIGGMVASPTPTVPISSDSTNVIAIEWPTALTKAAAAIHPAEPPPTITIERSISEPFFVIVTAHLSPISVGKT
jgi:hypothetical protein